MHTPVFFEQAVEALAVKTDGQYIDGTVGEGGHVRQIVAQGGSVLGIDLDKTQIERLQQEIKNDKFQFVVGNFADIEQIAKDNHFSPVDGILLDFGLSMRQINESGKGFSYKQGNDPLDMRLSDKEELTAKEIVRLFSEEELYDMMARNAEELKAKQIAKAIVQKRRFKKIQTVSDLLDVLDTVLPIDQRERSYSRVFQALRIEVNDEFENIRKVLTGGMNILKPGGKMVIITFHSVEDRLVKQFARKNNIKLQVKDIKDNEKRSFERSAVLRILEKI